MRKQHKIDQLKKHSDEVFKHSHDWKTFRNTLFIFLKSWSSSKTTRSSQKKKKRPLLSALKGSSLVPRLAGLSPGCSRSASPGSTTLAPTLTSTVRMVNWVHCHTSNSWPATQPPALPGLSELLSPMAGIRNHPDGCPAARIDPLFWTRRQSHQTPVRRGLFKNLGTGSCGANKLPALAGVHLNVVDNGPDAHGGERHATPDHGVDVHMKQLVRHSVTQRLWTFLSHICTKWQLQPEWQLRGPTQFPQGEEKRRSWTDKSSESKELETKDDLHQGIG